MKVKFILIVSVFVKFNCFSQTIAKLDTNNLKIIETQEVVITATQTEKFADELTCPIKVITSEQIKQMGSLRLNDVLQEQTGLVIVSDHGTGIQMQGFNPEYTLILIDGEPLIGRTAGTFDLSRITLGNIKRIEIIKGPSSSLYGSEALAGVINIITEQPKKRFTSRIATRYGSNQTADLTADLSLKKGKFSSYIFANYYKTNGYDLIKNDDNRTVFPFGNYTFQGKIAYKPNQKLQIQCSGRLFMENQFSNYGFTEENQYFKIDQKGNQHDWNINPSLTYKITNRTKLLSKFYHTYYHTNTLMNNILDGSVYDNSFFNQQFSRPEIQMHHHWNENQESVFGLGTIWESVNASRYTKEQHFNTQYIYAQHDISITKKLNTIIGARFDNHSVYGKQFSPKFSAKYNFSKYFVLKTSIGRGFKSPDFRQLYLNFANPVAGYSVFGSEEVQYQLDKLQKQGLIKQILINNTTATKLKAESSIAYNVGFETKLGKSFTFITNFFRNDINDMIETSVIALKTNGQAVYSYYNVSSVFTQGLEIESNYKLNNNISFSAGYQYLEAKNKQIIDDIKNGKYFTRDATTFITKQLTLKEYGGLFNRSKHSFNIKFNYNNPLKGLDFNLRAIYRGQYGLGDLNGNLILDQENEYVDGYWLVNVGAGKKLLKKYTLRAGIDNVLNFTNPTAISTIPGRLWYASFSVDLGK